MGCPFLYNVLICTSVHAAVHVNGVGVGHGKVNRLLVCHIPFHSESSFWQE